MTVIGTINNAQPIVPNPEDVLCGAGKAIMSHPGNKAFRELIKESVGNYSEGDKYMKATIVKNILNAVLANNGRFMKQRSDKSWCILSWDKAEEKTAQALRDAKNNKNKKRLVVREPIDMKDNMENLLGDSGDVKMLSSQFSSMSMISGVLSSTFSVHLSLEGILSKDDEDFMLLSSCFSVTSTNKGAAPKESDVLCGSGKAVMNHPGNRKFRAMVKAVATRSPDDPGHMSSSTEIVQNVKNIGGRFLKQKSQGVWYPITDTEAVNKTSQALRDAKRWTLRQKRTDQTPVYSPEWDPLVLAPMPVAPCFILPSSNKNVYNPTVADVTSGADLAMSSFGARFDDPSFVLTYEISATMDSIIETLLISLGASFSFSETSGTTVQRESLKSVVRNGAHMAWNDR